MTATTPPLCLNAFNGSPFFGGQEDLDSWILAASAAGFPLISPDRFALEAWLAQGKTLLDLATRMRSAGVACGAITAVALLGAGDASHELRWAADAAEALSASFLQVNVGASNRDARLRAVENACALIEGRGLRLAIEYLPFTPLDQVAETIAIVNEVGRERAGAVIDIWHHSFGPDDWSALETVPIDAVAYIEIDDAPELESGDLSAETLSRRVAPGQGIFDLERFLRLFRDKGYRDMISVEILSETWRSRPPSEQALEAYTSLAPYLSS